MGGSIKKITQNYKTVQIHAIRKVKVNGPLLILLRAAKIGPARAHLGENLKLGRDPGGAGDALLRDDLNQALRVTLHARRRNDQAGPTEEGRENLPH